MGKEEQHEIVIVGGGICGLATALALLRKGIPSLVLEKSETLRASGAAIGIFLNGWRALDKLGVGNELRTKAIPLLDFRDVWHNKTEKIRVIPCRNEALQYLKRSDLIETLAHNLPVESIRLSCRVVAIEEDPFTSLHWIHVDDGSIIKAKVLIGCDGANSVIARSLGLETPRLSPIIAVRGLTRYSEGHSHLPCFVRQWHDGCIFGRVPINNELVYWFIASKTPLPESEFQNDPLHIRDLALELMKRFPEEIKLVDQCDIHSLSLTHVRYRTPWHLLFGNFVRGTATVAGDAMHVMAPVLGQGGSAGLEDAIVLARHLAGEIHGAGDQDLDGDQLRRRVERALEEYVRERRMRLLSLSMQSFLVSLMFTSSMAKRLLCIAILWVFFGGVSLHHAHYDCGPL